MNSLAKKFPRWTVTAITVALLGNIFAAMLPVLTLLQMPEGSSGRLMADAFHAFVIAAVTFLLVIWLVVIGLYKERRFLIAFAAFCLGLTPFLFSGWVMNLVSELRHITLEP